MYAVREISILSSIEMNATPDREVNWQVDSAIHEPRKPFSDIPVPRIYARWRRKVAVECKAMSRLMAADELILVVVPARAMWPGGLRVVHGIRGTER